MCNSLNNNDLNYILSLCVNYNHNKLAVIIALYGAIAYFWFHKTNRAP
jgi:hypothetical protein